MENWHRKTSTETFNDLRIILIVLKISKIHSFILIIYFPTQNGFRKKQIRILALTTVLNDLIEAFGGGQESILVLLNYPKGFDSIDHRLLLSEHKYYGFDNNAVSSNQYHFSGRSQKVQVGDELSVLPGRFWSTIRVNIGPLSIFIDTADLLKSPQYCRH